MNGPKDTVVHLDFTPGLFFVASLLVLVQFLASPLFNIVMRFHSSYYRALSISALEPAPRRATFRPCCIISYHHNKAGLGPVGRVMLRAWPLPVRLTIKRRKCASTGISFLLSNFTNTSQHVQGKQNKMIVWQSDLPVVTQLRLKSAGVPQRISPF